MELVSLCPALIQPSSDLKPDTQTARARASLKQALNRYQSFARSLRQRPLSGGTSDRVQRQIQQLSVTLNKLEAGLIRIAVFGLVSRGKSAVLNAIVGQQVLPTGPLNGVTLEPRSVFWTPERSMAHSDAVQGASPPAIELIDTPGLDEIDGQARAQMAQDIARQADLILFVVSGDITRTEYQALCDLRQAQKPLLLVFNKVDLYPDQTRQAIYQNLQRLAAKTYGGESLQQLLSAHEIVLVAADPAPWQVRIEQPNGRVSYEWERPPIQIEPLKQAILAILAREGKTLAALNALFQARDAEALLATQLMEAKQAEAEALIWKFVRYKAIAIALNPIAVLDIIGGAVSDLAMIRALSELYGLPVTRHEASKLWRTILLSSGGLLVSEWGSGLLLGFGKSATAIASLDNAPGFSAYAGVAVAQAGVAGYGTYAVGRAIQAYLEQGSSWGPQGPNTVIQEILSQLEPNTIIYRLRQELSQELGLPNP